MNTVNSYIYLVASFLAMTCESIIFLPDYVAAQNTSIHSEALGSFVGIHKEKGIDSDGDGRFDEIQVSIEFNAAVSCEVSVNWELREDERSLPTSLEEWNDHLTVPVPTYQPRVKLRAGQTHVLVHHFSTEVISALSEEGPYNVLVTVGAQRSIGPIPVSTTLTMRRYAHNDLRSRSAHLSIIDINTFDIEKDSNPDGVFVDASVVSSLDGDFIVRGKFIGHTPDKPSRDIHLLSSDYGKSNEVNLKKGVAKNVRLFFTDSPSEIASGTTYRFTSIEMLVMEKLSDGNVVIRGGASKVDPIAITFTARSRPSPRSWQSEAEVVLRGIDDDKNGLFEAWAVDLTISKLESVKHRIRLSLAYENFPVIHSGNHFCLVRKGLCQISARVPSDKLLSKRNRKKRIQVSARLYRFDQKRLEALRKLKLLSEATFERSKAEGVYVGQVPQIDPLFFSDEQLTQSESSQPVYLFGDFEDSLIDSNKDGSFDAMVITAKVSVRQAGRYVLNGSLLGPKNESVGFFSTIQTLSKGVHTIPLEIKLEELKEIAGPYTFHNCQFYLDIGKDTPKNMVASYTCSQVHQEAYTTKSYEALPGF